MKSEMNISEILIETCRAEEQSPQICSALRGIKLTHKISGDFAISSKGKSQRANYLVALELLKLNFGKITI
jgi:hypothetical protein